MHEIAADEFWTSRRRLQVERSCISTFWGRLGNVTKRLERLEYGLVGTLKGRVLEDLMDVLTVSKRRSVSSSSTASQMCRLRAEGSPYGFGAQG